MKRPVLRRYSWLLAPVAACSLLVLLTLVTLQVVHHRLVVSDVLWHAQVRLILAEGLDRPPGPVHEPAAADSDRASAADGPLMAAQADPLLGMYRLARNLILALCGVAIALVLWLTWRMQRNRKRLAEREALYRQVLDHLPLMVRIRDLDGRIRLENRATRNSDIAQWGTLDLHGDQRATQDLPPLSQVIWETQRATLQSGTPQERLFELGDARQPEFRAYRLISFPIYDVNGAPRALGSLAVEETEQTRDRYALASLASDLERQVQERTVELVAAKEQAEAATRAKATFLANMSHEIRSPLNALVGLSHLARRSDHKPQLDGYLDKILKSAEHLQDVVGDILDFSKIEAGEMQIERVSFSLQRLIDSVVDIVWERARDKPLQLIVDIDAQLPGHFYGDPLRIVQILINFMDNAIKFTDRGTISLRVLPGELHGDRCQLHFEIQDSGVGIPADRLEEMFKPFQQLDDSTTRRYGGTGLGLAICAQLTKLLGGQLSARSEPGVGSLFRLSLELQIAVNHEPDGAADGSPGQSLAGRHLLLVEDDALNREVATELLKVLGLQVSTAVNGAEALQALAGDPDIELVLLDMQMPVMDGLETIRRLRPQYPDLPVIAMTANNLVGDRERCLQAGMSDYLAKPIDPTQLEAILERWLCRTPEIQLPEPAEPEGEHLLPTIPGLDQGAALSRLLNNRTLYLSLLRRFVEDYADVLPTLHEQLTLGHFEKAQEQLHSFKSLAGTLGAEPLRLLSMELEICLRDGRGWTDTYQRFASEFERLLQALREALAAHRPV